MSNPLPITFPDKENSPELLAYLAQFGPSLYVDANEINQIKAALNWLYNNVGGGSGVTNNTGFTPGDEEYIFNTGFGWKLNGVDYAISEALSVPVPYAAAGMHRIDLIVANSTTLVRIPGPEVPVGDSEAEPIYNQLTQLRVTAIPVNEDGFGETTPVESINQFVKKTEYSETAIEGTGEVTIVFTGESTAFRVLSPTITKIKGFNATTEFMQQLFYIGKEIRLINNTDANITLPHNDTDTAWPFRFPTGLNFVWKPRHVVIFRPTKTDAQYLEFQSDSVDVAGGKNRYFMHIKIDGIALQTINTWYSYRKSAANYDQGAFYGDYGTGSSPVLATLFGSGIPVTPPNNTKLIEAWWRAETLSSWGSASLDVRIDTNETLNNVGMNPAVPYNNQTPASASWNPLAVAVNSTIIKELTINPHDAFTEFTQLHLSARKTVLSGSGVNKMEWILTFEDA